MDLRRSLFLLVLSLVSVAYATEPQEKGNSILLVIKPYRHAGTWVFDDEKAGLTREPFIAGAPEILDKMVEDIPNAAKGFRLLFPDRDFPRATHKFVWRRPDKGGHWYYSSDCKKEGWLCPSLMKYFRTAPRFFCAKAEPIKEAAARDE